VPQLPQRVEKFTIAIASKKINFSLAKAFSRYQNKIKQNALIILLNIGNVLS